MVYSALSKPCALDHASGRTGPGSDLPSKVRHTLPRRPFPPLPLSALIEKMILVRVSTPGALLQLSFLLD
jgi:hypothetical protein